MQSRFMSFVESLANILVGFGVAILSQVIVFPIFGIHVPFVTNLWIGLWFTVISLIRQFILRRYFNGLKFTKCPPEST